jgi:hypothetical protein
MISRSLGKFTLALQVGMIAGANPTTLSYNASVVKINSATNSCVFMIKIFFSDVKTL